MKITFESEDRIFTYTSDAVVTEDMLYAVRDGLIAMGFHPSTAKQFIKEMGDVSDGYD